ncbi:hypothetical protein QYZ87_08175 [Porphyromonadaceae bacterium W3.11]|nr:hypothetical protein [Porphyromonadaceae bacterium W3.11]
MKKKNILLLVISFLLLTLSGCKSEEKKELLQDVKISMEVKMPQNLSVEGVKGSIAYYWNKDLFLNLVLTQEGKKKSILLSPESIPAEGDRAYFQIDLDHKAFDFKKPIEIQGAVAIEKSDLIPVGGGTIIAPKGFGGLLPYDLLGEINQPLVLEKTSITPNQKEEALSTILKPQGQLIFLQLHNASKESVTPKTITFSSDKEVFPNEKNSFVTSIGEFEGTLSDTSIEFEFPQIGNVSPDWTQNYIVWIPSNKIESVRLKVAHETEDNETILNNSEEPTPLRKDGLPLISVNLTNEGGIDVGDDPNDEDADTSEGGDPHFSMNDIKFWVGEGENRAALVIEWHDDKHPDALVWGYRWDGEKTGIDMIKAIVEADPRLSVVIGKAFGGLNVVGGIGYQFKITSPRAYVLLNGEKLANNGNGTTFVESAKDFDKYTFSDPQGHWKSGFYTKGYWVYYSKDNRLDSWSYSQVVFGLRDLEDGCWDGWSFQDGMESFEGRPLGDKFVPAPLPSEVSITEN